MAAKTSPPVIPNRFREAIYHVEDAALGPDPAKKIGKWLYENRAQLVRGGDEQAAQRFNYELTNVDQFCPDLVVPLKRKLIEAIADPKVLGRLMIPEFDLRYIEMHATLYHQGSHFIWHDDAPDYNDELVPSRRATFTYYMHTDPKMFEGGELEFLDGTTVEPKNDRLCLFHPIQQHRVRKVECWSAHVLSGRWALMGWIHGDPPEGWVERIPELRGVPRSG